MSQRIAQLSLPAEIDGASLAERIAEAQRAGLRAVAARDRFPTYDRAVAGSDGIVWLREFPRPEEQEARWVLVSGDGTLAGQFIIPRDADVLSASPGWLLVLEEDELDAPIIRVLRHVGPD